MLIEDVLREMGYTSFDVAAEQAAAIDLAMIRCPDLITADDRLTQGSGIAAVRHICAHIAIPVVFITGVETGVPDAVCLVKPFRPAELHEAVETAIATARTYA
jgi:CheY-like chemotaxis protein